MDVAFVSVCVAAPMSRGVVSSRLSSIYHRDGGERLGVLRLPERAGRPNKIAGGD